MLWNWLKDLRRCLAWSCATLVATAGVCHAEDSNDLKARLEAQEKQIKELKEAMEKQKKDADEKKLKDEAEKQYKASNPCKDPNEDINKIIESYFIDHPGAGMPGGVQAGFKYGQGFVISSTRDPSYSNWSETGKIPFELRIRGRLQNMYEFYKVTDTVSHQTGVHSGNPNNPFSAPGDNTSPDFSQLEVKRMRLIFEGTAFDPDLRYRIQLDGGTRGIGGIDQRQGFFNNPLGNAQGGQGDANVDHAMRLFEGWVAKDWHGRPSCDPTAYQPTYTFMIGKAKPLFGLEEYLGSANEQFVEYSMADWFFDADDDNLQMMAGFEARMFDDRLFLNAKVTNGNETQTPNLSMDQWPGFQFGGWWDFGGTWNAKRNRWDLFGDCLSDIDWSPNPVVRVGGAVNLVPMGRRSDYTTAELDRVRAMAPAPGAGGNLSSILSGAGVAPLTAGINGTSPFAADAFDSYSYNVFLAAKWHGFSLYNEWWMRDLDNFRGTRIAGTPFNRSILYNSTAYTANSFTAAGTAVSLFPNNISITDFGTTVQAGYFVIPKKLELAARYSWIRGESGNINGSGNFVAGAAGSTPTTAKPGTFNTLSAAQVAALGAPAGTTIRVVNGAFRHYQEADEVGFAVNYYLYRQLVKWQTDFSLYHGGNPAAGGQSPAGFIPGVDGYMVRSQIQFAF
jgi:Phosphate-selective porin O and P